MRNLRLIARMDIKGPNLIKGIHLEGLRIIGDPQLYAKKYYENGADEIIYIDIVASLYQRSKLTQIVKKTASNVFVPITVGGGIRSIEDVTDLLNSGADKVAINTAVVKNPDLISDVANKFGSQCMVLNIEAKKKSKDKWEVYTDCGREKTGKDVIEWVKEATSKGAGEILLTSIDNEGTQKGFDTELTKQVSKNTNIPVIASGGMGTIDHLYEVVINADADAVAIAHLLHYNKINLIDLRKKIIDNKIKVRIFEQ